MRRKYMTDSENEKLKQHLKSLQHNGIIFGDKYPQVEKVEIHHSREHHSFAGPSKNEGIWTITPQSEYCFLLDCLNRECTSIGYDLKDAVVSAIRNHSEEVSGMMKCEGQEAPDHPEQSCDGTLKYTIKVIYK